MVKEHAKPFLIPFVPNPQNEKAEIMNNIANPGFSSNSFLQVNI